RSLQLIEFGISGFCRQTWNDAGSGVLPCAPPTFCLSVCGSRDTAFLNPLLRQAMQTRIVVAKYQLMYAAMVLVVGAQHRDSEPHPWDKSAVALWTQALLTM